MADLEESHKLNTKSDYMEQAQLATFVGERSANLPDGNYIMRNLGTIALDMQGEQRTAISKADYADYLQSVGGADYEPIRVRAELLENYERFGIAIDKLQAELEHTPSNKHHNFLAAGGNANIFFIEAGQKTYVVRRSKGRGSAARLVNDHVGGAVLSRGLPHFEQIIAASYEDGVTIAEKMPGKQIDRLGQEEIHTITDIQLSDLVDTVLTAHEKGILLDQRPSNFFYDTQEGFGVIDFTSIKENHDPHRTIEDAPVLVGSMAGILARAGRTVPVEATPEQYAESLEYKKSNLAVMERYRQVVAGRLQGGNAQVALEGVDRHLREIRTGIAEYSDPDWVAEQCRPRHEVLAGRDEVW